MSFIFLRTDAFLNNITASRDQALLDLNKEVRRPIRRPYRGIQIKEDRFSTLSVRGPGNKVIPLTSSSDVRGSGTTSGRTGRVQEYSDYILQSISEQRTEKQQIIETFGDPYVYFFGERPRIVEVSGLLLNTEDFNWKSQFWKNYDEKLRGTKLVQQNARVYLSWDTTIIEGYMLQAAAAEQSEEPYSVPFSFSMLITGYHDWSDIGQTRFPGYAQKLESFDVLNRDLEDRRSQFTSTGAEVRLKNLLADPGGGVLSSIRGAIRNVNTLVSQASNLIDKVGNVVGGRTVRVPIGVAGFLQSTGAAQIGVGSIGGSAVLSASGLGSQFDAVTGRFEGVNGSVKLRMPGTAMFAPPWISDVSGTQRGYIFENIDEYPTLGDPLILRQLTTLSQYMNLMERRLNRQLAIEDNDLRLIIHNQLAEGGGILGDLAEAVDFAKSSFGMAMSALAVGRTVARAIETGDLGGLRALSGLDTGAGSQTSRSRIEGRREELEKAGIKTSFEDKSFLEKVGNFIGGAAIRTFEAAATGEAENPQAVSLGKAYGSDAAYQPTAVSNSLTYENAYGDQNYNSLLGTDPETQATLDEVYGNTDEDSELDPASLSDVYGSGSSSSAARTPEEIAAILAAVQSGAPGTADEDRTGIRGVGDDDAPIDPII